jgi:outer membrane lipoprotein-sorting protein
MTFVRLTTLLLLSLFLVTGAQAAADKKKAATLTADQIIAKMDSNQVFSSRKAETTMIIYKRGRKRKKKMLSYSKGEKTSYSEFLSPARDKGIKYLKLNDNLWMYLPSAEKTMKISGHMLRQSMMGSDFSYEDMLDAAALRSRYTNKVTGSGKVDGRDCYVIEMKQKKRGETYPTRKVWVDKTRFVSLKMELYAASGRLMKVMTMSDVKKIEKRWYPHTIKMINKLRRGTWTKIKMTKIEFHVKLPGQIFSVRNLSRE